MIKPRMSDDQVLLGILRSRGAMTSAEVQAAIRKSQPSVSRLLSGLTDEVIPLGKGRATRYAAAQPIGIEAAQHPVWLVDQEGNVKRIGTLSFLAQNQIHIDAVEVDDFQNRSLPWYLSPLKAQGFLGRLLAQQAYMRGAPSNPELWDLETVLSAALHLHDAPGSLLIGHGEREYGESAHAIPTSAADQGQVLDELALSIARTLPAGSSAGGEQPKFLAVTEQGDQVLVKFSPPRGTPFGERWNDLLYAESISNEVLERHGHQTAGTRVIQSQARTYLISSRFDRVGRKGRKHVVSVGAAHSAFVPGSYSNWASTCEALARQGKLSQIDAEAAGFLLQFGRLAGNTDMHSGNLSLYAEGSDLQEISKGNFRLAPVYDMLPMRWRPDPTIGLQDYSPFSIDDYLASQQVRAAALDFWVAIQEHPQISQAMKNVASEMAARVSETDSNATRDRRG